MENLDLSSMKLVDRPETFDFEGISMTHYFTDNWEKVKNFQARPDDILIATYPKAGTTWVSYILDLLYFGNDALECETSLPIYMRVPFLESCFQGSPTGTEMADNLPTSPRLIKTHLPVQLVPKSFWEQNSRVVYVARNAKDNAVSYFHFDRMNMVQPEPGDWNKFLQKFLKGKRTLPCVLTATEVLSLSDFAPILEPSVLAPILEPSVLAPILEPSVLAPILEPSILTPVLETPDPIHSLKLSPGSITPNQKDAPFGRDETSAAGVEHQIPKSLSAGVSRKAR
ncbi:cytosolic sulfotransferase 3-like isoform X2 [Myxocyprinus asiaticus]|uniref:cytosolic sulfotransferase 3-like isoform X2 n=1 Tax=Myxocyprinus asiaticus TaxID=70543 RepID=UPI00222135C8|nr:cytosolic sulfotransferase 3-like isoform X2 [Myxocyprinus asiaticus]